MNDMSVTTKTPATGVILSDGAAPERPHALAPEEVARAYGVAAARGLSAADVATRLERYGPNRLAEPAKIGRAHV